MALLIKRFLENYSYLFEELADSRTTDYFLMKSPLQPLVLLIAYNYFIFALGPKLMKNKDAFKLDLTLSIYNLFQSLFNAYIFINIFKITLNLNPLCSPVDYSTSPDSLMITRMCYGYFLLKVLDLLDTIFFVLRKNYHQVSLLHVYHHNIMVACIWIGVKYVPGGHSVYIIFLNTFVHIAMYFYYFISIWNQDKSRMIWWKKHITQLQLVQFLCISLVVMSALLQKSCTYPKSMLSIQFTQNLVMLFMFSDFYLKKYVLNKKKITN